ncbi:cytochrome b-245 chaperone 1/Eros family protein [Leptolyngbya sp. AN03gr2]|uniref:cytochrome b-245 chaperone 1/Eros family protein n=1 Tax=unclassified Leptolyngbya TaxID=2650499 RepID=UPI003D321FED
MRVVEHTHTRLKLRHRPIEFWLFGVALSIVSLSAFFVWLTEPASTQLFCQRSQVNFVSCQLRRSTILGFKSYQTVNNVVSIGESSRKVGKNRWIPFLTLATPNQQITISNSEGRTQTATQIEAFLNNPRSTSLSVNYVRSLYSSDTLNLMFFTPLMAIFFLMMPRQSYTFYRSLSKLVISQKNALGRTEREYALEEIESVSVEEHRSRRSGVFYHIVILLKNGIKIQLPSNAMISHESTQRKIARQIQQFLGGYDSIPD